MIDQDVDYTYLDNPKNNGADAIVTSSPIPVLDKISKSFEPLPSLLSDSRINLLYYHYFINVAARSLVSHDCEENPFRKILPEMAVREAWGSDGTLLGLLLTFSACHRAHMRNYNVPVYEIAQWVGNIFIKFLKTAARPETSTNSTLASLLMMASIEIVSPNVFEANIPWQEHLAMARDVMTARDAMIARNDRIKIEYSDCVANFLSRWFAYLNIIGSLSGKRVYWSTPEPPPSSKASRGDSQIDCLFGFTQRCARNLAHISELAKAVQDEDRISEEVEARAQKIGQDLRKGIRKLAYHACGCSSPTSPPSPTFLENLTTPEANAVNWMYHHAALIHLHRRVFKHAKTHPSVQDAVRHIETLQMDVKTGSPAEKRLLFPLFTASCNAQEQGEIYEVRMRQKAWEDLVERLDFFG